MKKFVYGLQNILNIQYKLEEQQKMIFAQASRKLQEEEDELRRLMMQKESYEVYYARLMSENLDIPKIKECKKAIDVMKSKIRDQMIEVHIAEKTLDAARNKLQEIMVTRKSHEILKEKQWEKYLQEVDAEERIQIDELVSYNYVTKE